MGQIPRRGLFAQRKQASGEADAQRQENLAARVTLCEELEQAIAIGSACQLNIGQLLSQSAASWRSAGAVPPYCIWKYSQA
ncbi:DUF349 domain-containing protein [Undibacterium piscinae]|uniref:DUF349 domain-containing protein n=1 Tax=Undibacterium piscinae TaxID=2495591 RepID=A0A6M4A866_9BURK|nr:DUF349 domain-containing protein [Undibacterium piscinae]